MTRQTLTTYADYNNAPIGTVAIDENGYAWQKVEKHTRTQKGTEMTTLDITATDELNALPVGSLVYDKYGDYWEKRPEGWTLYALTEGVEIDDELAPFTLIAQ